MKRNAYYFSKQALFAALKAMVYFAVLEVAFGMGDASVPEHWTLFMMSNFLIIFFMSEIFYQRDIRLAIIMSQTRKNIFIGSLVSTLTYVGITLLELVVLVTVFGFSYGTLQFYQLATIMIGTILAGNAFGVLLAIGREIFGRVFALIMCVVLSVLMGIGVGYGIINIAAIVAACAQGFSESLLILSAVVALWSVIMVINRKMIQHYHFSI